MLFGCDENAHMYLEIAIETESLRKFIGRMRKIRDVFKTYYVSLFSVLQSRWVQFFPPLKYPEDVGLHGPDPLRRRVFFLMLI